MTDILPDEPQLEARERRLYRFVRVVGWTLVGLYFIAALGVFALRFFVLPRVDDYRAEISRIVSEAVGERVEIGGVDADWFALHPRLELSRVRVLDRHGDVALELPYASATLAWRSLLYMELRFRSLILDRPDMKMRRDPSGRLYIAGLALRPTEHYGDSGIADWLIDQGQIVIREARIEWLDEVRGAPPLRLEKVSFLLENHGSRHRFALRAEPPSEQAAPLDVRGDLYGSAAAPIDNWQGRVYVTSAYVDLAAWHQWVDYPFEVNAGRGALTAWLSFRGRHLTDLSADVALADVSTRLAGDLEVLELASIQGRIGSRERRTPFNLGELLRGAGQKYEAYGEQLALVTRSGVRLGPTDFRAAWQPGNGERAAQGEFTLRTLGIGALALVGAYVPLPDKLRRALTELDPQGRLDDLRFSWVGDLEAPASFQAKSRFAGLGMQPWQGVPGFSGLSGSVDATEQGGRMVIDATNATISAPDLFPDPPLRFDALTARLGWTQQAPGIELRIDDLTMVNADLAATVAGTYRSTYETPGAVDFSANVVRAAGPKVYRYIPKIGVKLRGWLREAIYAGTATDGQIHVQGDLGEFPFRDGKGGVFRITGNATGVALRFAEGWPDLTGIGGEFEIDSQVLRIRAASGEMLGARVRSLRAGVPDLFSNDERMSVAGEAEGDTAAFLKIVAQSPVNEQIGGFTEGWSAEGRGKLALKFELPFARIHEAKVAGSYQLTDTRLMPGPEIPELSHVNGTVSFTETDVSAKRIAAEIYGGPLAFEFATRGDGTVALKGAGSFDAGRLAREGRVPLAERAQGGADYRLAMTFRGRDADFSVESDLVGVALALPPPFRKDAADPWPSRVERTIGRVPDVGGGSIRQDTVSVALGKILNAQAQIRVAQGVSEIERAAIGIGSAGVAMPREHGVLVAVNLPELDLDALSGLVPRETLSGGTRLVTALTVRADTLVALDRRLHDVTLRARRTGDPLDDRWQAQIKSREIVGNVAWRSEGRGSLVARLERLELPDAQVPAPGAENAFNELPALDVVADDVLRSGRSLGRLELIAVNDSGDWRIKRCELRAPEGSILAQGTWRPRSVLPERTAVAFKVETSDAGKYLSRFGYVDAVARGEGTLEGDLVWRGPPHSIDYASLSGAVRLGGGKGQFLKAEPGIGKLLGLLSLQSLPRRGIGDFADVTGKGFAFDSIVATAKVSSGVMFTRDFVMIGPAAAVTMKGSTDIARETQKLEMRVVPEVGGGVAAAAGIALLNPIIGAGTLLAQQLLKNPIGQMIALEYDISGTWRDPKVEQRTAAVTVDPSTSSN
ncbi:MAG: TIGR02099 family protein [Betaproteobacteria bacterium]|jgi:uncharacterized protein (TIGR02099 family)|nr:TIGR02099 family protein [Betaproteobacteria bacterium]